MVSDGEIRFIEGEDKIGEGRNYYRTDLMWTMKAVDQSAQYELDNLVESIYQKKLNMESNGYGE